MNIGIVQGHGILDQKFLQIFRVMGKIMDQGFDQKAVFDMNDFIVMQGDIQVLVAMNVSLAFQFISPDIAFIKDGIVHHTFSQEVTSGQAGLIETEIERMMGGEAVKGIEFSELL